MLIMAKIKPYEELTFTDDFCFCKVMQKPEICKGVLGIILNKKIKSIVQSDCQDAIEITANGKGIRLDVIVEDEEETIYNIEMQTTFAADLPKRSRYYQGMIDLNCIERGASYNELKKSYVIFLCSFDPFKRGIVQYTFENMCSEIPELHLNDETNKIFINPNGDDSECRTEFKNFLAYLRDRVVFDAFAELIDQAVDEVREHQEWRAEYMTLNLKLKEEFEQGRVEGREVGLAEGRAEGTNRMARLVEALLNANRYDDAKKAASDEDFREKLFREFNL